MNKNKNTQKTIQRREDILKYAAKSFAEKGYHKTTLDDIARKIGISKPALYYYIKSKNELLQEITQQVMTGITQVMVEIESSHLTPSDKLRRFTHEAIIFACEHRTAYRILFEQDHMLPRKARENIQKERKELEQFLQCIIEEGIRDDSLAVIDPKIACFTVLGACDWPYRWYHSNGLLNPMQIADVIIDLLENGYIRKKQKGRQI